MAIARFLRRLMPTRPFADPPCPNPPCPGPPRPTRPLCVIGDVHGCDGLLADLLNRLALRHDAAALRVVLAGDLIDRGPDSAAVLHRICLLTENPAPFAQVICLMGNHERMLLNFLADPARHGAAWLIQGGAQTLHSFGVNPDRRRNPDAATPDLPPAPPPLVALRDALRNAMPAGLEDWLAALPLWWQEAGLAVAHAGADPRLPLDRQPETALLWGQSAFFQRPRADDLWIAHGHFIVPDPLAKAGRIAVDTGAWKTGRLTAAMLDKDGIGFIQAGGAS